MYNVIKFPIEKLLSKSPRRAVKVRAPEPADHADLTNIEVDLIERLFIELGEPVDGRIPGKDQKSSRSGDRRDRDCGENENAPPSTYFFGQLGSRIRIVVP